MSSDLGGGKTTFTKGLAKGLGSTQVVTSPTFMVSQVYECANDMHLHHFDFYRLHEGGVVAYELSEVFEDPIAVVVVEWGDVVSGTIPVEHIELRFDRVADGEDVRGITAKYPPKFAYIFEVAK